MERTLVLIKPDAVQRGLIGNIITRLENKGLKIVALKMITVEETLLIEHYAHIADKPFFGGLRDFMQSSPIVALAVEGLDAVTVVRQLCGATNGRQADVGTIRGDLSMSISNNIVHSSDSLEAAAEELNRFFEEGDIFEYDKAEYLHVYASDERATA